ncbi:hypothetical protein [Leptolyngbya sp. CCY15150]|uniref:hypothetical protein n=1 Tax=Leptolyngbya sp. CCY15150 TaxID=2767772 RepID=UPI00195231B4|nr:hypothetical protein [Leptolyngbya sp. CCY15150]
MLEFIVQVLLAGGSATVISLSLLKWLGDKWITHQLSQKLESFKRQQSELLEQYRYQINARFNRITKIHEKEFEVLPEIWYRLQDTYRHFQALSSPEQSFSDLDRFSSEQLEAFLEKCLLNDFQKEQLRCSTHKINYYKDTIYWIRLSIACQVFEEFRKYLHYNKIFLSQDLFELLTKIESALIETQVDLETPGPKLWKEGRVINKKLNEAVGELLKQVENAVQKRLHFNQA